MLRGRANRTITTTTTETGEEMTPGAATAVAEIRHTLRGLVISVIVLGIVVLALTGYSYSQANQTHDSLCALRGDLQDRVEQTQVFLDNPEKYPQFNDPKLLALTRQQVENQQRTIDALSNLNC